MELRAFIHENLEKLQKLGMDVLSEEETLAEGILCMPADMLEDMEPSQIFGMLLSSVGAVLERSGRPAEMYVFDVELPDPSQMCTEFLQGISGISGGELEITDIEEAYSEEVLEAGTGTWPVRFLCNQTAYQYEANIYYDWFDTGLLAFMGRVVEEQNTGRRLYAFSDGFQDCMIFYRTKEWAENFKELFHAELERL